MNKKVVIAIATVIVVALVVLAVLFAPNLTEMLLRAHGLR